MQDLAPSASARITSIPERIPLSNITSLLEPTASTISGSTSIDDGAPSSWRPPWLDTTSACAPVLTASSASSTSRMPFRISLHGQVLRIQSLHFPFREVSNCDAVHSDSLVRSAVPLTWPTMLPKLRRLPRSTPATHDGLLAKRSSFHSDPSAR